MALALQKLIKDILKVDIDDILSCWKWRLIDVKVQSVLVVTCLGDLFFLGQEDVVYWLQTDNGNLTKVADNLHQFQNDLKFDDNLDNWFGSFIIEELLSIGKTLKDNQVYSYKQPPIIGGEYSINNIEITDISVHFAFSGQICEQVNDLLDGTKVNINFKKAQ